MHVFRNMLLLGEASKVHLGDPQGLQCPVVAHSTGPPWMMEPIWPDRLFLSY